MKMLLPPGWPKPKGYANGIVAEGKMVFTAGLVGWDENEEFVSDDFVEQAQKALENIRTVLAEAGAKPADIVRLTWYIRNRQDYLDNLSAMGEAYRSVMGQHFPAMAMVEVSALMESRAKVEIEATAILP